MFIPTLRNQTTDEQKKLFLEPALNHRIIGCYAQTEVSKKILDQISVYAKVIDDIAWSWFQCSRFGNNCYLYP